MDNACKLLKWNFQNIMLISKIYSYRQFGDGHKDTEYTRYSNLVEERTNTRNPYVDKEVSETTIVSNIELLDAISDSGCKDLKEFSNKFLEVKGTYKVVFQSYKNENLLFVKQVSRRNYAHVVDATSNEQCNCGMKYRGYFLTEWEAKKAVFSGTY